MGPNRELAKRLRTKAAAVSKKNTFKLETRAYRIYDAIILPIIIEKSFDGGTEVLLRDTQALFNINASCFETIIPMQLLGSRAYALNGDKDLRIEWDESSDCPSCVVTDDDDIDFADDDDIDVEGADETQTC